MGPKSNHWCPWRGEDTQRHIEERRPHEDRGRDWRDEATSQGMLRIVGSYQKLEEARKDSSLEPSEGAWLY